MKNRIYLSKQRIVKWWQTMDKRHTWWRVANVAAVVVLVLSSFTPYFGDVLAQCAYALSDSSRKLVGDANADLAGQLIYNPEENTYLFNVSAQKPAEDNPAAALQAQVGSSTGDSSDKSLYSLDVSAQFAHGVKYHDVNSGLEFTMKPQFGGMDGKLVDDHLVFPIGGGKQAIYTLKGNGLKEDIVVQHVQSDTLEFNYQLNLPKTLQARMIPDGNGAVGIYAADPSLYSNMQYGSDADRTAVEKARETGEKNYLVFGLPAPVSRDLSDRAVGHSKFVLDGDKLTVVVNGLANIKGPITVDPSVVVTSSSDFQVGGNDEGMIDFSTSGQIARGGLTGAAIGSWASTTNFTDARRWSASVDYDGYLYVIGGYNNSGVKLNSVQYAKINADGTVGAWSTTTSFTTGRYSHASVAYNGYLYVIGGNSDGGLANDVQYAKINADGTVGAWSTTTSFTTGRESHASVAYNGYLYVIGGTSGSTNHNDVQYAKLNADGTVGSWLTTTSFTTGRYYHASVAYNGYLYVIGGLYSSGPLSDVQYAKINADGTVGAWSTTTSFTTGRYGHASVAYNGYLYVIAGYSTGYLSDVQYAKINADGTLGAWSTTTSLTTGRIYHASVAYNGYLYMIGGYDGFNHNDVQYAKVQPPGYTTPFATASNNFSTAVALACSVAYNGYIYKIGGSTSDSNRDNVSTVYYGALDAATGDIGPWSTATALPSTYGSTGCTIYNNRLYVIGGFSGKSGASSKAVFYTTIGSNGALGTWVTAANSLPNTAQNKPGVFSYERVGGTYLYVLGGCTAVGNVLCGTIYYANVTASNAEPGTWTTASNSMINNYAARAYAMVGKYVYAMGGASGTSGANTDVEYAPVNSDGSLGAWSNTAGLATAVAYTSATTVGGCIYVVGGEDSSLAAVSAVQYACPNSDGTIGAWTSLPSLTVATTDMGVTSYNGYIYGVGGYTNAVTSSTQYAQVNGLSNEGGINSGAWSPTTSFTISRYSHTSVVYNGYLYVIGGYNGSYLNDTQYAKINADGTVGAWSPTTSFTNSRYGHTSVVYNGYLYVIGGYNGGYLNDIQYAKINADGTVGAWSPTTSFTISRYSHTSVVYNGYLYVIGGYNGSYLNDTQYAKINADGTLGTWLTTTSFATGRSYHTSVVYNGYLYVIGGMTGFGSTLNDTQYAKINADGTVGAWSPTTSFTNSRYGHTSVVYNGYLYVIGGYNGGYLNDIQYAKINADGTLGTWLTTTSFATGRSYHTSVVYNGYLYVVGGYNGPYMNGVQYAKLNGGYKGLYSKLIDLGSSSKITGITYNGSIADGDVAINYRTAGANAVFGNTMQLSDLGGSGGGASTCPLPSELARYIWISVTLGPDDYLTDLTVDYSSIHPSPDIRLRGGKTLQQSQGLSAFDTCGP